MIQQYTSDMGVGSVILSAGLNVPWLLSSLLRPSDGVCMRLEVSMRCSSILLFHGAYSSLHALGLANNWFQNSVQTTPPWWRLPSAIKLRGGISGIPGSPFASRAGAKTL